jgi:hypothetical protein
MDDFVINNIDELCALMRQNSDICLFFDTNMIISYYDIHDDNNINVRRIVSENPGRCYVTPSVVTECVRQPPGPEFIRLEYPPHCSQRLTRAWQRLKELMRIGDNFKTDIIILFEVGCLAPYVPDKNIIFPHSVFITQNMKFMRRCLENPEKRLQVQQTISQSGLENLTCAYNLDGDKMTPFVRKGGGADPTFVI